MNQDSRERCGRGRVMLVTGGSRGIGETLVRGFAAQGYRIAFNYSRAADEAERLARETAAAGGEVLPLQADIASRAAVRAMFDAIEAQWGPVDLLINNAGVNRDGPFLSMDQEQWQRVVDVNLTGTFNCSQEYAQRYPGRAGHIIMMGAATALHGRRNGVNYCSAKAGIMSLTKCLAIELAPTIAVNCVVPGFMETEEVMERFGLHDPDQRRAMEAQIPAGRLGTTEDIFRMTSFLINEASYITGQQLFVNGGQYRG